MRAPSIGRILILGWLFVEVLAYLTFFRFFSVGAGLLVGLGSIALGLLTLRLLGQRITGQAAAELMGVAAGALPGSLPLAVMGAILLLLPGFVSDLLGVLMIIAGGKALLGARPSARPQEIDLAPHEWTRRPDDHPPR